MWYDEIKDFRFGYGGFAMNTGENSNNYDKDFISILVNNLFCENSGHFTQVVWKGTKEMGVGRATARSGNFYVVANYAPPGNMQGAFTANVLPPGNYNIPDPTKPKKTGLEGEVCDLVGKNAEDTVKSIAEEVYSHVTTISFRCEVPFSSTGQPGHMTARTSLYVHNRSQLYVDVTKFRFY